MTYEIIISGFGGQGILAAGMLLAYAAVLEDKYVSWLPSYGPEKRGGTSNCHVVISDEPVGSPFITNPRVAIVMSKPAFDKYEIAVSEGGILLCDSLAVTEKPSRRDIQVVEIPATQMTAEMGIPKMANMVLIGKLLDKTKVLREDFIIEALYEVLPQHKHNLIPDEIKTLKLGMNYGA